MAIPVAPPPLLSAAQLASIPSTALPVKAQLIHLIQEFTRLSLQLFALLSQSSTSASASAAPIYVQLAALDRQLTGLMPILAAHQQRQRQIQRLIQDLSETEQAWQEGARVLHTAKQQLDPVVRSGASDRQSIERAIRSGDGDSSDGEGQSTAALCPATILSYARLLAPFTSAPPSSLLLPDQQLLGEGGAGPHLDPTGTRLPQGAWPPFPTEGAMRRGRLQFGKEEPILGESEEVGARRESQSQVEGAGVLTGATMATAAAAVPSTARQDSASKLAQVAKQQQRRERAQAEQSNVEQEDFSFDLDLNPDL